MRSLSHPALVGAALSVIWLAAGSMPASAEDAVQVLPPKRPATFARVVDVTTTGAITPLPETDDDEGPVQLAQATPAKPALGERAIVERANAALNAVSTFVADFQQVSGDGRRFGGTVYVQRPGKLRFDYDKPATLEIVSDGSTVIVRDRKLKTNDPYPISQTPLKFLTSARIDLARDASVTGAAIEKDGARVNLEDSSTLGGTSKITLYFDPDFKQLRRWRVVDPQGYATTVTLRDIEQNKPIDAKIFNPTYTRPQE